MEVNRGKQFEGCIEKAFKDMEDTSVYRLIDPMGGQKGVANICDYIVYSFPTIFYIECKSVHKNTFNFHLLTKNQYEGMVRMTEVNHVQAGVMLWFIDHDVTFYVPITEIKKRIENGDKSIRYTDDYFKIDGKKKRVLFDYDMTSFYEKWREKV